MKGPNYKYSVMYSDSNSEAIKGPNMLPYVANGNPLKRISQKLTNCYNK